MLTKIIKKLQINRPLAFLQQPSLRHVLYEISIYKYKKAQCPFFWIPKINIESFSFTIYWGRYYLVFYNINKVVTAYTLK